MGTGIEAINTYVGQACINVQDIFDARGLDDKRMANLMIHSKTIGLPCEDPVTNAVNAAKPIIDALSKEDKESIAMVITATESGVDFGKSLSTYIHDYLGLSNRCRLFEVKQACYGGTAALQMALCFVESDVSPGAKVLVIATDVARSANKNTYMEPSQGVAAVAMLVGEDAEIVEMDMGANGYYGKEIMDTCRPMPELETGDPDASLLAYIQALEGAYENYVESVEQVEFTKTFSYLCFHTPYGGLVKSAHRKLMMSCGVSAKEAIQEDFESRVAPSIVFPTMTGNSYSATLYVALTSLLSNIEIAESTRIGLYSYGSGCSAEFFSGKISPASVESVKALQIQNKLDSRYQLMIDDYDQLLDVSGEWLFGVKDKTVDISDFSEIYEQQFESKGLLVLEKAVNYHREYRWS